MFFFKNSFIFFLIAKWTILTIFFKLILFTNIAWEISFLFIGNEYFYNGKRINILERIPNIIKRLPSIKHIVITNYPGKPELKKIPKYNN